MSLPATSQRTDQRDIRLARRAQFLRARLLAVAFALTVLIGLAALLVTSLVRSQQMLVLEAERITSSLAAAVENFVGRSILAVDAMLQGLPTALDRDFPIAEMDGPGVKAILRQVNEQSFLIRNIRLVDERGLLVNDGLARRTRPTSLADEPWFRHYREGRLTGFAMFPPMRDRLVGIWSLTMVRPVVLPNGFRGLAVADVPVSGFSDFFNSVASSDGLRISLFQTDGVLVASDPPAEDRIGQSFATHPHIQQAIAGERTGIFHGPGVLDTGQRIGAWRQVPVRPVLVTVSIDHEKHMVYWYQDRSRSLLIFCGIAGAILVLTAVVFKLFRSQEHAMETLVSSEARFAETAQLLQTTLDSMSEGLSVFSEDLMMVAWNQQFLELLQIPEQFNRPGVSVREILTFQAERGDFGPVNVEAEVRERLARIRAATGVAMVRTREDGHILRLRRRPMPGGGVVTIYSDVTQDRLREQQLIQAQQAAERANKAKSEFLSSMSHELRTPLNAVLGYAQLMRVNPAEPLTADQTEAVDAILQAGDHLLRLISDVLDLARIESGSIALSIERVDVCKALDHLRQNLQPLARRRGIDLVIDAPSVSFEVMSDLTRLNQILLNLGSNAVKYNRDGGRVTVSVEPRIGGVLRIAVADTGFGIPADLQPSVFQAFNRLGQENSAVEGTGIGLNITRRLVEMMGGQIGFESLVGVGSTFWVDLPLAEADPEPLLPVDQPLLPAAVAGTRERTRHVLYVEDNPSNLALMRKVILRLPRIRLTTEEDGARGLAAALADPPDLIILDIHLPSMTGFEILAVLRNHPATSGTPVLALSAAAMPEDVERALEAGFDRYLTKPINVLDVVKTVEELLVSPGA
ncbi:MAG: PAS-domain containing protein [Alphaproteobacteria bacterium]|nr:PAS-domain containing protein [Alphaproteobacteria bacterium]